MTESMNEIKVITTEDGSHSLFNSSLNETYHSVHGAIQESQHVFIRAGLEYWINKNKKANVRIFEVGFGTGLNAFLTGIYPAKGLNIYYESWETNPVSEELSNQLNYHESLGSRDIFTNLHKAFWDQAVVISKEFTLHKHKGDIIHDDLSSSLFDLIFYDAFGPSKQPGMWTKAVLEKIVSLLDDRGIFVTYCAKGQVKRDLKSLGLIVDTLPGPPGKLQMIRATKLNA